MIRAAIFDLDELIIDLERIHKAAERQICLEYGHSFDITVCGEDVRQGKLNPEPYRLTAERLTISPEEGLVFEDADVGVQSAKAAGLWCIGVPNPAAATPQTLQQADLVLPDLTHFTLDIFKASQMQK